MTRTPPDNRWTMSFLNGKNRFNYRVAGLALRGGHVLVCREDADNFVLLPGGRVEFGEASDLALLREIREELQCVVSIGRLLFSVENFFEREGERLHELARYYAIELPDDFPFSTDTPALVTEDEGHELTFEWIKADGEALARINLLPEWLRGRFGDLPSTTEHLIVDER